MWIKKSTFQILDIFLTVLFIWSFNIRMGVCQETETGAAPESIKIAGLQMNVTREIQKNKQTILTNIRLAAEDGARFLVTPEGSLSGYHADFDQEELFHALQEVRTTARVHGIGLFLGTCYKEMVDNQEITYNQIRVYAPDGSFLGAHSKILLCSPVTTPGTGEMHDYGQGYLKTIEWEGLRFGMLICNDLWATPGYTTLPNTYLPLQLKQMGADIIIHSINSGSDQRYRNFHESSVELWAYTLHLPILEVNAAMATDPVNAQSGLIDAQGERMVQVPEIGEHLFYCEIPAVTP